MPGLSFRLHFGKNYKLLFAIAAVSLLAGILSLCWPFWLLFGIILYVIAIVYFSREFRDLLNIHVAALSLIVLYAIPTTYLILQGEMSLDTQESLALFSSITLGLIGYICGALFLRKVSSFEKKQGTHLSKQANTLFSLAYKYRYILGFICCIILLYQGFMPLSMSYTESVLYRAETTGFSAYFNSLIPAVFSVLTIAMISIIGDLKKGRKLSWLSYFLIILVIASIVGGLRSWIIALFVCLMLALQPYLKRKYMVLIVILAALMTFVISGGVRYARGGVSFIEILNNLWLYFSLVRSGTFTDLMWGWSDFTSPFATFITLVKTIPQNMNFDCTLPLKDLSLMIPTILYPDRPLPPSMWYVQTFDPELFQRGGGHTFYVIGFGYLFAGPVGALFYLFLYGILFEWLSKVFKMVGGAAGLFLYSYFFVSLFAFVVGGGPAVFIKASLIMHFFPLFLLGIFLVILNSLKLKRWKTAI